MSSPSTAKAPPATTKNLELLKKWLSVAESQICSLEVLSAQLPEVSQRMESDMEEITQTFVHMASDIRAYDESVKQIRNIADSAEPDETAEETLTQGLEALKTLLAEEGAAVSPAVLKKIDGLIDRSTHHAEETSAALEVAAKVSEEISNSLSKIIMAMQFQDWVAQNLVITVNVLNANITYLKEEIDVTIKALDKVEQHARLDPIFAKTLVEHFKLGELQRKFVDHLITHEYIKDGAEIGFNPLAAVKNDDEDGVDLF